MTSFVAGFAARHDAAAQALQAAFAPVGDAGFAPSDIRARAKPKSFAPEGAQPKHFAPADPDANPTEGWDPFDAAAAPSQFVDPLAAAHAAGHAEGLTAALAQGGDDFARRQALLGDLAAALASAARFDREAMARQLRQTVMFLVTKTIGEAGVSPDLLAHRIEAASDLLANAAESAILRVSPDDVALLEGLLPATIFPVGDALVARGSFVLESASTIVEDGPDLWLEQLASALDRVALPPSC
jgi:flagellar assembly protein FliH